MTWGSIRYWGARGLHSRVIYRQNNLAKTFIFKGDRTWNTMRDKSFKVRVKGINTHKFDDW